MPKANTRYWTIPLTVLLFVNTVLVALAARQVGIAGDPAAALGQTAPGLEPSETPAGDPAAPSTDSAGATPAAVAPLAGEYFTTEDWPTAEELRTNGPAAGPQTAIVPDAPPGNAERPAVDPAPPTTEQSNIPRDVLIFINPPTTGGVVHFLLEGEVISLAPGELARVLGKGSRLVQFHRGDDFGDEELRAEVGAFAFAVGDRGWTLVEAEAAVAARLLQVCRPVAPAAATQ